MQANTKVANVLKMYKIIKKLKKIVCSCLFLLFFGVAVLFFVCFIDE